MKKTFTRKRKSTVEQVEERSSRRGESKVRVEFLDTGSTRLNLAASGKGKDGGWARGRIVNFVGDGSTGKTLLALEACAQDFYFIRNKESILFPKVKKVSIVYDNSEAVMDFPLEEMYKKPFVDGVEWIRSPTCEAMGRSFQRRVSELKRGDHLLYVADSLDTFESSAAKARIEKSIKTDKDIEGTYGMEKAKYFSSAFFNHLTGIMQGKDATLICLSQVRDNINAGMWGAKHKRVGGKALDFYTHQVCWLAQIEEYKKTIRKETRTFGVKIKAKFKRNKTAKPFREATFDILYDHGIDNIGSITKYLGYEDEYIETLENDPDELANVIQQLEDDWQEIEEKIKPKRKERFGL